MQAKESRKGIIIRAEILTNNGRKNLLGNGFPLFSELSTYIIDASFLKGESDRSTFNEV